MGNSLASRRPASISPDGGRPPDLLKQISSKYNVDELSQLQKTLSGQYRNLDVSSINDVLKAICIGKENKQSFSFLIDVCSLVSVKSVDKDEFTLQKFISDQHINVFDSKGLNFSKEDFSNACNQYISAFGDCVEPIVHPEIQISDSMSAFLSYTISMSNAIKQYVDPKPPTCPLIIDFWIIPNLTIGADGPLENEIGDIEHRLKSNRLIYTKKACTPKNVDLNIDKIIQCLSSKDITDALQERNLNRVVFIIDRRYSTIVKGKDFMFCYVPPNEYSKTVGSGDYYPELLSLCHAHCSSNYLLPKSSKSPNSITGASPLNGYLFMLSFLVYERQENEEKEEANDALSKKDKGQIQDEAKQINDLSQISTAFVKCYFHHQGFRMRFFPNQIWTIWQKYFVNKGLIGLHDDDEIKKIVSSAFGLYRMFGIGNQFF